MADVDALIDSYNLIYQQYTSPVIIGVYIGIALWKFGYVGIFISGYILTMLWVVSAFNRIIINKTKERVALTDIRSARVSEFLQKMKHIKMVGLENHFEQEIWEARKEECLSLRSVFYWRIAFDSVLEMSPTLIIVLVLAFQYYVSGLW